MNLSDEITALIEEIRNDKTHGASQLARQAAQVLKIAAERSRAESAEEFLQEQQEIGQKLISVRPAMAPIFNIVTRLLKAIADTSLDLNSIRQLTTARADELINGSLEAIARIAGYGADLITSGDRIMTHSYSSTVVAVLQEAFTRHRNIEVIITRAGPGRTGERTVHELGIYGASLTFIDDAAVGLYLPTVNKAMVGADRICADGEVINGTGTYLLALASKRVGIPLYVFCEALKFDPRLSSHKVDLEEKEPAEVIEPGKLPPEVKVKNPYFDITPLELVTMVITENGPLTAEEVTSYLQRQPD